MPARDERDRSRRHLDPAELGLRFDRAVLRDDQQLAVGIDEDAASMHLLRAIEMDRDAFEIGRVAVGQHRHQAVDEIRACGRSAGGFQRSRLGASGAFPSRARTASRRHSGERPMVRGRPHPVQPAASVLVPRRGEGASRKLLGVEAEGRPLRGIAPLRKRAFDGFAFEMAAKAGHIAERVGHSARVSRSALQTQTGAAP